MANTGAMVALIPSVETAQRLAVPGLGVGEAELHCTLLFLGDAADIVPATESEIIEAARRTAAVTEPFAADGFSVDIFNPDSDSSCIVLGLSGGGLEHPRDLILSELGDVVAPQRQPWIPHITLIYTGDVELAPELVDRCGPVLFDRIRVAFADTWIDIPLGAGQPVQDGSVGVEAESPAHVVSGDADSLIDVETLFAAVNAGGWSKLPVADRETKFAFRAAVDRLAAHAASVEQFSSWFFWRDPRKPPNNRNSYRMPFADVFDGTVKLVPAAVFSAAAQLSGAHGALPIIPEAEKEQIRRTIDRIYDKFRNLWDDPRQVPPWERPATESAADEPVKAAIVTERDTMPIELVEDDTLTAAVPIAAPAAWFQDPQLTAATKPRADAAGRVWGHLAQWDTCHRGIGNSCVLAPRSITNYAHFKTGTTLTADGILLPVGNLTFGAGHADTSMGYLAAASHYDDAATKIARVNVGEDAFGIWFAGALAAGAGELEAQQLREHPLSGDWRRTGGNLELIAALAVNTPGFNIAEPQYSITASGEQTSLLSAGIVFEDGIAASVDVLGPEEMAKLAERAAALEVQAAELRAKADRRRARTILDMKLPVRS